MYMLKFIDHKMRVDEAPISALKALKATGILRGVLTPQKVPLEKISYEEAAILKEVGIKTIPDGSRGFATLSFAD